MLPTDAENWDPGEYWSSEAPKVFFSSSCVLQRLGHSKYRWNFFRMNIRLLKVRLFTELRTHYYILLGVLKGLFWCNLVGKIVIYKHFFLISFWFLSIIVSRAVLSFFCLSVFVLYVWLQLEIIVLYVFTFFVALL